MEDKFPDRWLAIVDGSYKDGTVFSSCLSGVVIAAFTSQEYAKNFSEYDGKWFLIALFPSVRACI